MTADLQQLSLSPSRRTPVQKMHMLAIEGAAVSTIGLMTQRVADAGASMITAARTAGTASAAVTRARVVIAADRAQIPRCLNSGTTFFGL